MRSGVVLALLLVSGCIQQPNEATTKKLETVPSVAATEMNPNLQALGTEPFWSFEIVGKSMKFSSPENLAGTEIPYNLTRLQPGWRFAGATDGKLLVLSIMPGQCSDGMSDTVYPYKATFKWGERTEQGCAREK